MSVSSLFKNARETAAKAPWADAKIETSVTLSCPACGAPQEVAADFLCRYCRAPMGKQRDPQAQGPAPGATGPGAAAAGPQGGGAPPQPQTAAPRADRGDSTMTPSQQAIVTRWRAFMSKVMGRLRDVLTEAEDGCRELIRSNPADPVPLNNVLGALRSRKINLDKKIYDVWSKEVCEQLADEAEARRDIQGAVEYRGKLVDQAEAEMKQALAWMDDTWERFRVRWAAESARAMWPVAEQAMKKPVNCTQCGAGLTPRVRHQSDSVTCPACRAVNQVVPEPVVGLYFATAAHALAEEATFQKRQAITNYGRQVEAWRSAENARTGEWPEEGVQSLKQREQMERDYWTAYVQMKARIEQMTPDEQQKFVESRMRPFIEDLERNPVWRRAHGMPT